MVEATSGRERWNALDFLKAAAIVAVVITHAGPDTVGRVGDDLVWDLTKTWTVFQVPSFLFVSGFLYAARAAGRAAVGSRLERVLLPYLVASCVVQLVGASQAQTAGEVFWQFLTASSLGIYYYVSLICGCILLSWPLARFSRVGILVAWVVYTAYSVVALLHPAFRTAGDFFWMLRDPLSLYALGFFLAGWASQLWLPELKRLRRRVPRVVLGVVVAVAAFGLALNLQWLPFSWGWFDRAVYTLAVVALFALLLSRRIAGPAVRFLADATLALYLFHFPFLLAVRPFLQEAPPLVSVGIQVLAGLAGACAVVWLARRLLGVPRARRWLGA
ncbi:MAG: acyltransferase [Myxococcota bacterium]|nr:acyltransferase [Myxococcota bacterium]